MVAAPTYSACKADLAECLEALLSESVDAAQARERTAFDQIAAPFERNLVLFGAGKFGNPTLAGLRKLGIEPLAFADNNPALWGTTLADLPVLSPEDAAKRFGAAATFLITVWNGSLPDRTGGRIRQLSALGCRRVTPVGLLYWKYPEVFLPFYPLDLPHKVLAQAAAVRSAFRLWQDDASRREYLSQVAFRLNLDYDGLSAPGSAHYFPCDIYHLTAREVLIDCGAYDGDTIRSFVARQGSFGGLIAFEPDRRSWALLQQTVADLPDSIRRKIVCFPHAVGAETGVVAFDDTGTELSTVGSGPSLVPVVTLDESLKDEKPTIIKFDIEGAELDALAGARQTIRRTLPVLAVSAYHRQTDLWQIPISIAALSAEYRFFLRPHGSEGWDLVCYGVPADRLAKSEET